MGRKRADEATTEVPETAAETQATTSKADAVRAALKEGHEKPKAGVAYIKEKFGLDVTTGIFSNYKSTLFRDEKKEKTPRIPKPRKAKGTTCSDASFPLAEAEVVKGLVNRLGCQTVHRLVDVFQ